jgi:hypothetical protein
MSWLPKAKSWFCTSKSDDIEQCVAENKQALADLSLPAVEPCSSASEIQPDNEDDSSLRIGAAGTSDLYARCDHNHPIKRLENPGYQDFTVNGSATVFQKINYGFWSDEESVYHRYRLGINVDAGNGWVWWNVPTIPGFQRPILQTLTTYRFSNGNPQQGANQLFGNMPDGPYMGSEAAEWTNIPRIYLGPFNHPTAARYYVHFVTQNIKL